MKLGPNVTGVTFCFDFDGTLELARKLWPQTRHVAIIAGVDASGRRTEALARRAFAKYSSDLEFTYFSGTPIDILMDEVQRLPSDTVIFVLSYVLDSRGTSTTTPNVASRVSRVANAPVFGFHETVFGHGLLGGHFVPFEKQGRLAGEMAVRVLHGEDPASIPVAGSQMHEHIFDWKELRRWQIPESMLPAESVVRFREPNLWDLYKYYLLAGIGLVILQSLLIVVLLVHRRRLRRAEAGLTENLRFEQVLSTLSSRLWRLPTVRSITSLSSLYRRSRRFSVSSVPACSSSPAKAAACARRTYGWSKEWSRRRSSLRLMSFHGFAPS